MWNEGCLPCGGHQTRVDVKRKMIREEAFPFFFRGGDGWVQLDGIAVVWLVVCDVRVIKVVIESEGLGEWKRVKKKSEKEWKRWGEGMVPYASFCQALGISPMMTLCVCRSIFFFLSPSFLFVILVWFCFVFLLIFAQKTKRRKEREKDVAPKTVQILFLLLTCSGLAVYIPPTLSPLCLWDVPEGLCSKYPFTSFAFIQPFPPSSFFSFPLHFNFVFNTPFTLSCALCVVTFCLF